MTSEIRFRVAIDGKEAVVGGAQVQQALAGIQRSQQQLTATSKMTAQQSVQLSAQLQDFAVQLQGGVNPLTALVQQGSQLSYVFGGVGNAVKAVGSLITPTVAGIGAVAAAVGGVTVAYAAGAAESKAFADALSLTGRAAGLTEGQFRGLAETIGARTSAGVGVARDALQQLVASGRLSGQALEATAGAATALARATGEDAADVAKRFAGMADDAAGAARKLNEQYHFLTAAQYAQIKAMQEAGDTSGAMATTMRELEGRINTSVQNLGTLESAWVGVKRAITGAWEAMKDIGRETTLQDTIRALEVQIEANSRRTDGEDSFGPNGRRQGAAAQRAELERQLELLRKSAFLETERAAAAGRRAAQEQAGIKWIDEGNKYLDRRAQMEREIAGIKALAAAAGLKDDDAGLAARIAAVRDKYKETTTAARETGDAFASARDAAAQWAKVVEGAQARLASAQAAALGLSAAQAEIVKYLGSPAYAQASESARQLALGLLYAEVAAEDLAAAQKVGTKAAQEGAKAYTDQLAALTRSADAAQANVQRLEDEAAAVALVSERQVSLAEATAMVALERLREQQIGSMGNEAAVIAIQREIEARERLLTLIRSKDTREANARAAADHAREWERINDQVGQSLADALMQGGKSAAEYLKGLFRTMVLRPILQAVISPTAGGVLQAFGIAGGQAGGGNAGNLVAGYQTMSGAYNAWNGGFSAAGNAAAGAYSYGLTASGATYGTGFGTQQSLMLAQQEAGMGAASGASGSSALGTAASTAAGVAAGVYGGRAISGGYAAAGSDSGNSYVNAGTAIGAAVGSIIPVIGTAFGAAIGGLLGGVVNRAFGYKSPEVESREISGSFAGGDFSGETITNILQKGGWFKSDKRSSIGQAITGDLDKALDEGGRQVAEMAKRYGDALGLPVAELANVSQTIRVKVTGDIAEDTKSIESALAEYSNALFASFADEVAPLAQYGETTAQTIARVGQAILSVNDVLDALGLEALALSVDGGKAAQALGAMFGGIEGLQQAAGGYLQGYYAQAERAELVTQALGKTMADLGLAMPATRDAFRELVGAQDLSTEAGRRTFAALMGVADAFAQVTRSADDIAAERAGLTKQLLQLQGDTTALRALEREALDSSNRALYDQIQALTDQQAAAQEAADSARAMADASREAAQSMADSWARLTEGMDDGVRSAFGVVSSLIDAERRKAESDAQTQVRELEAQAGRISSAWGGLIDGLGASLDSLRGLGSADGGRGAAMRTLRAASASLSAGQAIDLDSVRGAASQVSTLGTDAYGSRLDYQRAIAGTQTLLRDVMAGARRQMTSDLGAIAAAQVKVEARLAAQIKTLDQQLMEARSAAESLVSIDDGVQTVAEAIAALTSAIGAARAVRGDAAAPTGQWLRNGGAEVWAAAGGAVGARPAGSTDPSELVIKGKQSTFTAGEARAWVNAAIIGGREGDIVMRALAEGIDSSALDALMEWAPGTALAEAGKRGLPAFANGGVHLGGLRLVGERGPEIEATGPARIHTVEQLMQSVAGGPSDAMLRQLMDVLIRHLSGLTSGMHAVASNTRKLAELQDDVVNGGASVATRAEA